MRLKTDYKVGEIPHDEHPRPQAARENWLCLNGKWRLQKLDADANMLFEGEILVPFSPESENSGIGEGFVLGQNELLVYTRTFVPSEKLLGGRVLLHFGAVDSECEVRINGQPVGVHRGGFTPFSFEITEVLVPGENEICVICSDGATRNGGARGKQSDKRGGIWYTPQSGIWQTVWLEGVPQSYIKHLKITPDVVKNTVEICSESDGLAQEIVVFDEGREILRERYTERVVLSYPFALWSPESPKLYDIVITNEAGDRLCSYFGMRSFGITRDKSGKPRLALNGKPYFFNGVLDQGYWSDGLLTYPSDKAARDELQMLKEMGFNTVRKHIKLEPMRWYYHCDRLGLVVWQDFVNGGGEYKFTHVAAFPFLGFHHRDDDYAYFARQDEDGRAEFYDAVEETVTALYNCVSIGVWVPFNEGWGQFDSAEISALVHRLDPTRIVDSVSGWHDQGVGKTDLKSLHTYYTPLRVPRDPRPVVLSEFGGYSMKVQGHVFDEEKEFGYKKFHTVSALCDALETLFLKKLMPLLKKGLCGCIYTQVSDVEEEINGLVTYDRKVVKVPVERMAAINRRLMEEAEKIQ